MDRVEKLIEIYKVSRSSVEHFEKIIGVFRQIIFTFNGIFISSGLAFYLSYLAKQIENVGINRPSVEANEKIYAILFATNMVLAITNFIVWLLEKHYYRFLFIAALVAEHIEEKLFTSDKEKRLSYQLRSSFNKWKFPLISSLIRSYDFLYLLPILGSISISNWLLDHSFINKQYPQLKVFTSNLPKLLLFFCICIIIYNFIFTTKKAKLRKT